MAQNLLNGLKKLATRVRKNSTKPLEKQKEANKPNLEIRDPSLPLVFHFEIALEPLFVLFVNVTIWLGKHLWVGLRICLAPFCKIVIFAMLKRKFNVDFDDCYLVPSLFEEGNFVCCERSSRDRLDAMRLRESSSTI